MQQIELSGKGEGLATSYNDGLWMWTNGVGLCLGRMRYARWAERRHRVASRFLNVQMISTVDV